MIHKICKVLKTLDIKKTSDPIKNQATDLNKIFSKEETQTAEKPVTKCSTFLTIREMHQTTLKLHLISVRMANINKTNDSSCWQGCGVRGTVIHCRWKCKLIQPLCKSVQQFLRKMGLKLLQNSATLGRKMLHPTTETLTQ